MHPVSYFAEWRTRAGRTLMLRGEGMPSAVLAGTVLSSRGHFVLRLGNGQKVVVRAKRGGR